MPKRNFSVVLNFNAAQDLEGVLAPWLKGNDVIGSYVNCKEIDPAGAYFRMVLEFPDGDQDFEVQIPHHAVKAIVHAPDLRKLGFV